MPLAALVAAVLVPGAAPGASRRLTPVRISTDPFGADVPGSHATEVEPSADAWGSTIVTAFQVGRHPNGSAAAIGFATSTDAGRSWQSGLLPGVTTSSPTPGTHGRASDPVVAHDAVHVRWLVSSGVRDGWLVSSSPDGLTWSPPATALVTDPATFDKDWLTCDSWLKSPFRGRCYLAYASWQTPPYSGQVSVAVQTSADGGLSWGPRILIPVEYDINTDTLSPELVVRPNGELVVLFFERSWVRVVRSNDGGSTFGARETVSTYSQRAYSFAPERFRGTAVPTVAVDAAGTVYAAWYDCRLRPGCTGNGIVLTRSSGPGVWTEPERVPLGSAGSSEDFLLPALGVDPTTSGQHARLALAYYTLSSFDCAGAGCMLSAGFATSRDGGLTWSDASVGDPMALDWLAPTSIGRMVGDYVAAVFVPGRAIGIFDLAGAPQSGRFDEVTAAVSVDLPEPPRNVRRPTMRGAARVGRTVTCFAGVWSGTRPLRFSYRWLHGGRLIPGLSGSRFRIRPADAGALIACRVDASNAAGSSRSKSSPVRVRRG